MWQPGLKSENVVFNMICGRRKKSGNVYLAYSLHSLMSYGRDSWAQGLLGNL